MNGNQSNVLIARCLDMRISAVRRKKGVRTEWIPVQRETQGEINGV